ncbi:hypothetical protein XM38_041020 [Halomicronema hongdechloris C2206]|uniref:Uncharacterized protein n=1 Tax=Halomicronema hongdechloris C2206 TaxID=1641165 RepID=A0A1Z3HS51_9CYAN|nr:hypothetical protein [Halomicronema hongdechloris]ASC73140.1 hypothetical protein XM38_041020 [Halomicronema hongdechloris C2206]
MKPIHILFATSLTTSTIAMLFTPTAEASDIALNFDLPEVSAAEPVAKPAPASTESTPGDPSEAPLPIPSAAANPPTARNWGTQPASVYDGSTTMALKSSQADTPANLPPAPPSPKQVTPSSQSDAQEPKPPAPAPIALTFKPPPNQVVAAAETSDGGSTADPAVAPQSEASSWSQLFDGGTDSLVARAVGSAEGTRTPAGQRTPAYYGHRDPGNGVWNLGTFSYQHGANAPEEADQKQLQRLQRQTELLNKKATAAGLSLTLAETLNGIDLANQSPWAAIGEGDYIGWLAKARQLGMEGEEAIAWARTRAFIDPDTQRWNAPGLGNNIHSISRDQERRMGAIAQALEHYSQSRQSQPSTTTTAEFSPEETMKVAQDLAADLSQEDASQEDVDIIFDLSLDQASEDQPSNQAASALTVPADSLGSATPLDPLTVEVSPQEGPDVSSASVDDLQAETAPQVTRLDRERLPSTAVPTLNFDHEEVDAAMEMPSPIADEALPTSSLPNPDQSAVSMPTESTSTDSAASSYRMPQG